MMVDAFGAGQIEVPFVDARAFDDGRVLLQCFADLGALLDALFEWHGDAHRLGAEPQRARDRHCRADAELAGFVGGGADAAAAVARAADDE